MSDTPKAQPTPFGKPMKEHFQFAPGWRNMNHGAFGSAPKALTQALRRFQDESEANPDTYYRYNYSTYLLRARRAAASLLHAPLNTIVFVPNATTGLNVVLRNLPFTATDHIIIFSPIYGAISRTAEYVNELTGAQVTKVPVVFPATTHEEILVSFRETVLRIKGKGENPKLAIFDTIASMPAVRFPFESLVKTCHEHGVLSLIDGAHSAGQIPMNLTALDADFYVSNLHKWLFVPRSCAVFYVAERNQKLIRSALPTSWNFRPKGDESLGFFPADSEGYTQTAFEGLFSTTGTLDVGPYFCVPEAIEWREKVCGGEQKIMEYCAGLAERGAEIVAKALGTKIMENVEGKLAKGNALRCVKLPELKGDVQKCGGWIMRYLADGWETLVPVFGEGDGLWVRLSAQVYLDEEDFEYLGRALKDACKAWNEENA